MIAKKELSNELTEQEVKKSRCDASILFVLPQDVKNEYKAFFASYGLSLSFGIRIAIDHLINDVKLKRGSLKTTGFTSNN